MTATATDRPPVCAIVVAGPGIGRAIARRFAREGFAVAAIARRRPALDDLCAGIAAKGGTARGFVADAADPAALAAALGTIAATMAARGTGTMLFTDGGLALRPEFGGAVPGLTAGKSALRGLVLAMAPELAAAGIHAATVTVAGMVAPGGPFDPDRIADAFWDVHAEPAGAWTTERIFAGTA